MLYIISDAIFIREIVYSSLSMPRQRENVVELFLDWYELQCSDSDGIRECFMAEVWLMKTIKGVRSAVCVLRLYRTHDVLNLSSIERKQNEMKRLACIQDECYIFIATNNIDVFFGRHQLLKE